MIYYRERQIISGKHKDVDITVQKTADRFTASRADRANITRSAQAELNGRNSRRRLLRTLNTNFTENDLFLTLTYGNDVTEEEAEKELHRHIDRLRTAYRNAGEELRYVYVTECGENDRVHHHIVIGAPESVSTEKIRAKWKAGHCFIKRIYEQENGFEKLAGYMVKNPNGKRRYTSSLNLKKPLEIVNDEKYSVKDVSRIVQAVRDGRGKEYAEKLYPGYRCTGLDIRYNEMFPGLPNVYIKLAKRQSAKRETVPPRERPDVWKRREICGIECLHV